METLIVTGGVSLDVLIVGLVAGKRMLTSGISRRRVVLVSLASSVMFLLLLSLVVMTVMGIRYIIVEDPEYSTGWDAA